MRTLLVFGALFVATVSCVADMPVCDKSHAGQFWPEEANNHPTLAAQFARNGELQICSHRGWHYRWLQPSVTVDQLRNSKAKAAIEGEADREKPLNDLKLRRSPPVARASRESSRTEQ